MPDEKKPMGRPPIYHERRKRINMEMPHDLWEAIGAAAAKAGTTRTRYIEQVMQNDPDVAAALAAGRENSHDE